MVPFFHEKRENKLENERKIKMNLIMTEMIKKKRVCALYMSVYGIW